MNKLYISLALLLLPLMGTIAQVPPGFKYQAVIRDASGNVLANKNVNIGIAILQGSEEGVEVFTETHDVDTNAFGLVNLEIGFSDPVAFASINWSLGDYYIQIGVNGKIMGTGRLLSVPYALYAGSSGSSEELQDIGLTGSELSISGGSTIDLTPLLLSNDNQTLSINGNELSIDGGNSITLPNGIGDADSDPTNEIELPTQSATDINKVLVADGVGNVSWQTDSGGQTVVDDLTTGGATEALSARQGKVLQTNKLEKSASFNGDVSGTYDNIQIAPGAITTTEISNGTIVAADLSQMSATDGQVLKWNSTLSAWETADDNGTTLSEAEVDAMVANNGFLTTEADGSVSNEIQDLQLSGNILTITDNGSATDIDLSPYLDDTDTKLSEAEVDAMVANNGYLTTQTDDQTAAEVSYDNTTSGLTASDVKAAIDELENEIDRANTDDQTLDLSGDDLSIEDGNSVDLSAYLDNTDDQTAAEVGVTASGNLTSTDVQSALVELQTELDTQTDDQTAAEVGVTASGNLVSTDVQSALVELQTELDAQTDDQTLGLSGDDLSIENGNSVDLSAYLDNTDDQTATEVGVTASGNLVSTDVQSALVELQTELDTQTDDQTAAEVGVTASGNLASTDVQSALVELQTELDTQTDDQTAGEVGVTASGNLASTDVQSALVELQTELDAQTDDQTAAEVSYDNTTSGLTANNVKAAIDELENEIDGVNTDDQTLGLSGDDLSIEDGNSVDLSAYLDNTDDQTAGEVDVTASGNLTSTDVQSALVELQTELDTQTDDQTAAEVSYDNTASGLTASNIKAAIDELENEIDGVNTDNQTLGLSGDNLSIENGNSVDLSAYLDNTDDQTAAEVSYDNTTSGLTASDVKAAIDELENEIDGVNTDDQTATEVAVTASGNLASTDVQSALVELQTELDAQTDDQTAAEVSYDNTASGLTANNVKAAIDELENAIDGANTDDQTLGLSGDDLSIEDGNSVDLSGYLDNTDDQTAAEVSYDNTTSGLTASDVKAAIDELENEIDGVNTDDQTATEVAVTASGNLASTDVQSALVELQTELDAQTDDQTLGLSGDDLSIENGNSVDLSGYLDNTDDQTAGEVDVTASGNLVSTDVQSALVELQTELDTQTDDQTAAEVGVTASGNLASTDVQSALVELQTELDTQTDDQTLGLSGDDLSIEGGNSVDLSGYLDNTDDQTAAEVSYDNTTSGLTASDVKAAIDELENEIDGVNTDNQTLGLSGDDLSIEDGNSVDLSAYLDNTDDQTATEVAVTASGNLASTDVQSALVELQTDIDANTTDIATETTDRTTADSDIQAELDATQAGAGLGADGTYTANAGANYIGSSTSLVSATEDLDAQVKTNADAISSGITAVGSMTSGDAFADATADDDWLGLGASAGRIEFDDQTTDEINILNANVGIGTSAPVAPLHVGGEVSKGGNDAIIVLSNETASSATEDALIQIGRRGHSTSVIGMTGSGAGATMSNNIFAIATESGRGGIDFRTDGSFASGLINGTSRLRITDDGSVGIGDATPDFLLDVAGTLGTDGDATISGGDVTIGDGSIAKAGTIVLHDADATNSFTTRLASNADVEADFTLTLPADDGDVDQVLVTDGSGALSWADDSNSQVTVVNDLTTGGTGDALSAEQGKVLQTNKLETTASFGGDVTGTYDNVQIATGAVTTTEIANGTITATDLSQMSATDGQILKWNNTSSAWEASSIGGSTITDADNDTKIQTEENADEDVIRFDLGGTEKWVMLGSRLEPMNAGGSVFIGDRAGANDDLSGNPNVFIGTLTGYSNTTGGANTGVGPSVLRHQTTGIGNTAMGYSTLVNNKTGGGNSGYGLSALQASELGNDNTAIGVRALFSTITGSYNTALGVGSGYNSTGSRNIFIGYSAGYNETGSNRLYIANSNSSDPLIYGEFDNDLLRVNGNLTVKNGTTSSGSLALYEDGDDGGNNVKIQARAMGADYTLTLPADDGDVDQVLVTDGSGALSWADDSNSQVTVVNDLTTGGTGDALSAEQGKVLQTNKLETTASFGGDVTGTYDNVQIATGAVTTTEIANGTITATDLSQMSATDGQILKWNNTSSTWEASSIGGSTIADADNDTKIQTEENADEDVIRFDLGGTEKWVMLGSRLEPVNTGSSLFIGNGAGANDDLTGNPNVFIGTHTGYSNTTGGANTGVGSSVLRLQTTGIGNTAMGYYTLVNNKTGGGNSGYGLGALQTSESGNDNTAIGVRALFSTNTGSYNTALGAGSGYNSTGSRNIFIGYGAGYNETGSSRLYIANSNSSDPLIYGEFDNDLLRVNGNLTVKNGTTSSGSLALYEDGDDGGNNVKIQARAMGADYTLTLPADGGAASQVLTTDGSGALSWTTPTGNITAVGSMTSGDAFADATADDNWLGLGASAGRIEFDDQTMDEINILNANVGIGTSAPVAPLHVGGEVSTGGNDARIVLSNETASSATEDALIQIGRRGHSTSVIGMTGSGAGATLSNNVFVMATESGRGGIDFRTGGSFASGLINGTSRLRITDAGNVGMGDATPTEAKLVVKGYQSSWLSFGYLNNSGAVGTNNGNNSYSIYADNRIAASEFNAHSDVRIKNIKGVSNSQEDLNTLMKIEITDYAMKDSVSQGTNVHKKVIAQQVDEVYTTAVSKNITECVPDIYKLASLENGWITLVTDLKVGEKVKLVLEKETKVVEVKEVSGTGFRIDKETAEEGKVFVYGREVNDFHTVDYSALSMLNISATQELYKRLIALERENQLLKSEREVMKAETASNKSEIEELKKVFDQFVNGGANKTKKTADNGINDQSQFP